MLIIYLCLSFFFVNLIHWLTCHLRTYSSLNATFCDIRNDVKLWLLLVFSQLFIATIKGPKEKPMKTHNIYKWEKGFFFLLHDKIKAWRLAVEFLHLNKIFLNKKGFDSIDKINYFLFWNGSASLEQRQKTPTFLCFCFDSLWFLVEVSFLAFFIIGSCDTSNEFQ